MRAQAAKEATHLADEARDTAAQIIGEAKATAERIRVDTERELAAAMQRRDSINAQLSNVRQMLATLTGTAPFALTGFADSDFAEDDIEPTDAEVATNADTPRRNSPPTSRTRPSPLPRLPTRRMPAKQATPRPATRTPSRTAGADLSANLQEIRRMTDVSARS